MQNDTIMYNANGKGVHLKHLAHYMRVVYKAPVGTQYPDVIRDYFMTGELYSEIESASYIDKYDDSKSKFIGKVTSFYKNGNKKSELFFNEKSIQEGNQSEYFENGSLKSNYNIVNGKINGKQLIFSEDGNGYVEIELIDDKPKYDYITHYNKYGTKTKYDINIDKIINDEPQLSDKKVTIENGKRFQYYEMNGVFVGVNLDFFQEAGKYWMASIVIGNNSNKSFIFNSSQVFMLYDDGQIEKYLTVHSFTEFSKRVGRKLKSRSFWNAVGENIATINAGTNITNTSGSSTSAGVAVNNHGTAVAGANVATIDVTTTSYSGAAQYQANQQARQNINEYNNTLMQYKNALDEGYLQSNTIEPGQVKTGYIAIDFLSKKDSQLHLFIPLNGVLYKFSWKFGKKGEEII